MFTRVIEIVCESFEIWCTRVAKYGVQELQTMVYRGCEIWCTRVANYGVQGLQNMVYKSCEKRFTNCKKEFMRVMEKLHTIFV